MVTLDLKDIAAFQDSWATIWKKIFWNSMFILCSDESSHWV